MNRPNYYRLDGHTPVPVADVTEWAAPFEARFACSPDDDPWRVARTDIGDAFVSTVFLGLDHQWHPNGPPELFETLVFDDSDDEIMERCSTWEQAVAQHDEIVARYRQDRT